MVIHMATFTMMQTNITPLTADRKMTIVICQQKGHTISFTHERFTVKLIWTVLHSNRCSYFSGMVVSRHEGSNMSCDHFLIEIWGEIDFILFYTKNV